MPIPLAAGALSATVARIAAPTVMRGGAALTFALSRLIKLFGSRAYKTQILKAISNVKGTASRTGRDGGVFEILRLFVQGKLPGGIKKEHLAAMQRIGGGDKAITGQISKAVSGAKSYVADRGVMATVRRKGREATLARVETAAGRSPEAIAELQATVSRGEDVAAAAAAVKWPVSWVRKFQKLPTGQKVMYGIMGATFGGAALQRAKPPQTQQVGVQGRLGAPGAPGGQPDIGAILQMGGLEGGGNMANVKEMTQVIQLITAMKELQSVNDAGRVVNPWLQAVQPVL